MEAAAELVFRAEAERQLLQLRVRLEAERDPIEREACERLTDAWEALLRLANSPERPVALSERYSAPVT